MSLSNKEFWVKVREASASMRYVLEGRITSGNKPLKDNEQNMDLRDNKRIISCASNTSGFNHDSKTDVRVCVASDIWLCRLVQVSREVREPRAEVENVYLFFTTTYLPELEIYFTTWALRAGNTGSEQQHRLEIMEWNGGLSINIRSGEHLQEALKSSITWIASGKWEWSGKDYTIIPVDELKQSFIEAGWVPEA